MNDGAAPNEMTSERESIWTPNSEEDLVILAIIPSTASKPAARRMNQHAGMNSFRLAWMIAMNPQNIFRTVKRLGTTARVMRMNAWSRLRVCRENRFAGRRRFPHRD